MPVELSGRGVYIAKLLAEDPLLKGAYREGKPQPGTISLIARHLDAALKNFERHGTKRPEQKPEDFPYMPQFQHHSFTSFEAACRVAGSRAIQMEQLYALLVRVGPLTDEEMQDITGWHSNTQRPRRIDLWDYGSALAVAHRELKSGGKGIVWKPTMHKPPNKEERAALRKAGLDKVDWAAGWSPGDGAPGDDDYDEDE